MRRDIRIAQPTLNSGPQQRAAGLIDTADYNGDIVKRCRDRAWYRDVDGSSANTLTDRCRCLFRFGQVTAGYDDTVRVVWSEFGGYSSPDNAIASNN